MHMKCSLFRLSNLKNVNRVKLVIKRSWENTALHQDSEE